MGAVVHLNVVRTTIDARVANAREAIRTHYRLRGVELTYITQAEARAEANIRRGVDFTVAVDRAVTCALSMALRGEPTPPRAA